MTASTSRRALLAGIAAVPALSLPAIADSAQAFDWLASANRLETIANVLRDFEKPVDLTAAARAVEYCRRCAAGEPEDDEAFQELVVGFIAAHRQSLDWILFGDPRCMIAEMAAAGRT